MIDYLAMLLEEQVWEDEEETASLELPPEGGTVWKKGRAERAPERETVELEAPDSFPAWLETERAAVQWEPIWEEKEEPSAQAEEALPEGGASGGGERPGSAPEWKHIPISPLGVPPIQFRDCSPGERDLSSAEDGTGGGGLCPSAGKRRGAAAEPDRAGGGGRPPPGGRAGPAGGAGRPAL